MKHTRTSSRRRKAQAEVIIPILAIALIIIVIMIFRGNLYQLVMCSPLVPDTSKNNKICDVAGNETSYSGATMTGISTMPTGVAGLIFGVNQVAKQADSKDQTPVWNDKLGVSCSLPYFKLPPDKEAAAKLVASELTSCHMKKRAMVSMYGGGDSRSPLPKVETCAIFDTSALQGEITESDVKRYLDNSAAAIDLRGGWFTGGSKVQWGVDNFETQTKNVISKDTGELRICSGLVVVSGEGSQNPVYVGAKEGSVRSHVTSLSSRQDYVCPNINEADGYTCRIQNFVLPQQNVKNERDGKEYVDAYRDPQYILFSEKFTKSEEVYWKYKVDWTDVALTIGPAVVLDFIPYAKNVIMPAIPALGRNVLRIVRSRATSGFTALAKEEFNTMLSSAERYYVSKKIIQIHSETVPIVEKELAPGTKAIIKEMEGEVALKTPSGMFKKTGDGISYHEGIVQSAIESASGRALKSGESDIVKQTAEVLSERIYVRLSGKLSLKPRQFLEESLKADGFDDAAIKQIGLSFQSKLEDRLAARYTDMLSGKTTSTELLANLDETLAADFDSTYDEVLAGLIKSEPADKMAKLLSHKENLKGSMKAISKSQAEIQLTQATAEVYNDAFASALTKAGKRITMKEYLKNIYGNKDYRILMYDSLNNFIETDGSKLVFNKAQFEQVLEYSTGKDGSRIANGIKYNIKYFEGGGDALDAVAGNPELTAMLKQNGFDVEIEDAAANVVQKNQLATKLEDVMKKYNAGGLKSVQWIANPKKAGYTKSAIVLYTIMQGLDNLNMVKNLPHGTNTLVMHQVADFSSPETMYDLNQNAKKYMLINTYSANGKFNRFFAVSPCSAYVVVRKGQCKCYNDPSAYHFTFGGEAPFNVEPDSVKFTDVFDVLPDKPSKETKQISKASVRYSLFAGEDYYDDTITSSYIDDDYFGNITDTSIAVRTCPEYSSLNGVFTALRSGMTKTIPEDETVNKELMDRWGLDTGNPITNVVNANHANAMTYDNDCIFVDMYPEQGSYCYMGYDEVLGGWITSMRTIEGGINAAAIGTMVTGVGIPIGLGTLTLTSMIESTLEVTLRDFLMKQNWPDGNH